jgi:hypothetical protein
VHHSADRLETHASYALVFKGHKLRRCFPLPLSGLASPSIRRYGSVSFSLEGDLLEEGHLDVAALNALQNKPGSWANGIKLIESHFFIDS